MIPKYENPEHRYSSTWNLVTPSTCMNEGLKTCTCLDCGYVDTCVLPKLPHTYSDVIRTAYISTEFDDNDVPHDHYMHWKYCKYCGEALNPGYEGINAFIQGVGDGCVISLIDSESFGFWHDWGDWICFTQPTSGTLGHWFRECKIMHSEEFPNDPNCAEREDFVGTQAEFEEWVGGHTWSEPIILWNYPEGKDTIIRTCITCGMVDEQYRPHEHTWSEWEEVDVLESGILMLRKCKYCGFEETMIFITPDFFLPNSLTEIDEEAFVGAAFKVVQLSEGTVSVGSRAFANCPNLTHIYIPNETTSIASDAFENVNGLTIFGKTGSTAEAYAESHRFTFVAFY